MEHRHFCSAGNRETWQYAQVTSRAKNLIFPIPTATGLFLFFLSYTNDFTPSSVHAAIHPIQLLLDYPVVSTLYRITTLKGKRWVETFRKGAFLEKNKLNNNSYLRVLTL
jgi:hypothetical protein